MIKPGQLFGRRQFFRKVPWKRLIIIHLIKHWTRELVLPLTRSPGYLHSQISF
jgi:hypothetical protein